VSDNKFRNVTARRFHVEYFAGGYASVWSGVACKVKSGAGEYFLIRAPVRLKHKIHVPLISP
jgi:hypothetical protein